MPPPREDGHLGREPLLNTPALVTWFIGVMGAVFLVQQLLPDDQAWRLVTSFGVIPARYSGDAMVASILPGDWARLVPLVSYSFLHGGTTHFLLNAAWLLAIGTPVAQRLGPARFVMFWIVTAVAAALLYIAVKADSAAPMIGASGAISGLFGGLARFMFGREPGGPLAGFTDRRVLMFAAAWLALNMVVGVTGVGTDGTAAIAWEAHVGGFIAGLILLPLFEPKREL